MSLMKVACLSAALAFGLAACGGPHQLSSDEQRSAEYGALKFAKDMGWDYVSCSGQDSEPDGYVTCTMKEANEVKSALCAYEKGAVGCKPK